MNKPNVKALITDLEQFDQAVERSAGRFNTTFTTKLVGLSNVFQKTADKINSSFGITMSQLSSKANQSANNIEAIFADMAVSNIDIFDVKTQTLTTKLYELSDSAKELNLKMSESFADFSEKIKESIQGIQELGSYEFAFLAENAISSFKYASENMIASLEELKAKLSIASLDMKNILKTVFADTTQAFKDSMYSMSASGKSQFAGIQNAGEACAERVQSCFEAAFGSINANMAGTQRVIEISCNRIRSTFSATAESARMHFFTSITGINQKIGEFEARCKDANESAGNAFNETGGFVAEFVDKMARLNIIVATFNNIVTMMKTLFASTKFAASALAAAKGTLGIKAKIAAIATAALKSAKTAGIAAVPIAAGVALTAAAISGAFATGGFPEMGQMFIAREAGPELVGQIGSRTAVANNNQIVESVSAGVYEAVREAIKNNSVVKNSPTEVKLYLDGKQITSAVERHQRERGLTLLGGEPYAF